MARQVIWTEVAWNDLEAVAEYITRDSAYYAAAFVHEVREAARSLTHLAARGRVVPEFRNRRICERVPQDERLLGCYAG